MVDIGFKNSSNSDRNEGPTPPPWSGGGRTVVPPPPDWNTIVVDGPPPDWNTIGEPGKGTCYELTIIYLSVVVNKKTKEWEVQSDMSTKSTQKTDSEGRVSRPFGWNSGTNIPSLSDLIYIVKRNKQLKGRLPSLYVGYTYDKEGKEGKYTIDEDKTGSIIKLCVCANSFQVGLAKGYLSSLGIGTKASKCKWTYVPGPIAGKHANKYDLYIEAHDKFVYRCAKFKISCDGCESKTCRCRNAKSINLTNINNKSKKYTDSNGNTVTLTNPGDYKKVIEQIVAAEDKIGLDCK